MSPTSSPNPKPMRILFISHYFPPEVNAPASRTHEHCREWVRQGHDVTVITGVPNHPRGVLFEGYVNRIFQEEEVDGIRVIRTFMFHATNEGFAGRIAAQEGLVDLVAAEAEEALGLLAHEQE